MPIREASCQVDPAARTARGDGAGKAHVAAVRAGRGSADSASRALAINAAAAAVPPKTVATPVADVEKGASSATSLERVQSTKSANTTTVTLSGNGRLAPANVTESKDRPRRLVLDFPNVGSKAPTQTAIDSQLVSRVRVGLNSSQPLVTRVVMELSSDATYRVERSGEEGRDLDVVFEPRVPSGVRVPVETARVNESTSAAADSSRPSAADSSKEEPITLQQAIANAAAITPKDDKPADAPRAASAPAPASRPAASQSLASQAPASRPSASQPPPSQPGSSQPIDAMAALRSSLITAPAASPAPAPASAAALAAKTSTSSATPSAPSAPSAPARASAPPQAVPNSLAAQAAAPAQTVLRPTTPAQQTTPTQEPQTLQTQGRQFTGHPVSLDFEGVDLRAVLRTFSDVSGLNMVIDPDVQGTVDIKLTDVPWDQALDVILRGNQLDYTVDGTIVRISRVKTLEDENKSRVAAAQAAAERAAQAGGMAFETYPLSYAKAADTAPLLERLAAAVALRPGAGRYPDEHAHHRRPARAAARDPSSCCDARSSRAAGRDRGAHHHDHARVRAGDRRPVGIERPDDAGARQHDEPGVPESGLGRRPGSTQGAPAATCGRPEPRDGDRRRSRRRRRQQRDRRSRSARSTAPSTSTSRCRRSSAPARAASCRRRA